MNQKERIKLFKELLTGLNVLLEDVSENEDLNKNPVQCYCHIYNGDLFSYNVTGENSFTLIHRSCGKAKVF